MPITELTAPVLDAPLSEDAARAASIDGWVEVVVVADVLELINSDPHRATRILVETVLEDPSCWRAMAPIRLLGDAPAHQADPRHQWMLVQVRLQLG